MPFGVADQSGYYNMPGGVLLYYEVRNRCWQSIGEIQGERGQYEGEGEMRERAFDQDELGYYKLT